ncbi:MAG: hypothetical protein JRF17_08425 [Deltaproteobacteria bacterium]|jgi:hypothetical protein|nr:hypothetical protein [Deltaproteobacteria bacterium]
MNSETLNNVTAAWVVKTIKDFINNSPYNSLASEKNEKDWILKKAWKEPMVGFSNGADPIYEDFKNHIGEFHWIPAEIFSEIYPTLSFSSDELTVISWILPQTDITKAGHRKASKIPNEDWIRARIFGEKINESVINYLQNIVAEYVKDNYGFPGRGGCGLCQTGVPCESKIPSLNGLEK